MSQRRENLMVTALRHGLRADTSIEDAAAELLRMANGDPRPIEQAIARLDRGSPQHPGAVGDYARQALRLALRRSLHPAISWAPPGAVGRSDDSSLLRAMPFASV
jgi:hypothetical protein